MWFSKSSCFCLPQHLTSGARSAEKCNHTILEKISLLWMSFQQPQIQYLNSICFSVVVSMCTAREFKTTKACKESNDPWCSSCNVWCTCLCTWGTKPSIKTLKDQIWLKLNYRMGYHWSNHIGILCTVQTFFAKHLKIRLRNFRICFHYIFDLHQ